MTLSNLSIDWHAGRATQVSLGAQNQLGYGVLIHHPTQRVPKLALPVLALPLEI
jgi:hypothetical protein